MLGVFSCDRFKHGRNIYTAMQNTQHKLTKALQDVELTIHQLISPTPFEHGVREGYQYLNYTMCGASGGWHLTYTPNPFSTKPQLVSECSMLHKISAARLLPKLLKEMEKIDADREVAVVVLIEQLEMWAPLKPKVVADGTNLICDEASPTGRTIDDEPEQNLPLHTS